MPGIILGLLLIALVASLGGIKAEALATGTIALVLSLFLIRIPVMPAVRRFWLLGFLFLGIVLVTLLPLPSKLSPLAGAARNDAFARVESLHSMLVPLLQSQTSTALGMEGATADWGIREAGDPPSHAVREPGVGGENPAFSPLEVPRRFSLNASGTQRFLLLTMMAWSAIWLAASLSPNNRRRMLKFMVVLGALVAGIGISAKTDVLPAILPWHPGDEFTWKGASIWPFINRNHFATFSAMLVPASLVLSLIPDLGMQPSLAGRPHPRRYILARAGERILYFACFVFLVSAVFLSLSRGGIISLFAGLLATVFLLLRNARPLTSTIAAALTIGVIFALLFLPSTKLQTKLASLRTPAATSVGGARLDLWKSSFSLWKDYPLLGSGMESYQVTFQKYKKDTSLTTAVFAESDYVELLTDGGGLAGLLLLALVIAYGQAFLVSPPPVTDPAPSSHRGAPLLAALLGALIVAIVHSATDFPLRIPLNALLVGTFLGLGLPVPGPTTSHADSRQRLIWRGVFAACTGLMLGTAFYTTGKVLSPSYLHDRDSGMEGRPIPKLEQVLHSAPTFWSPWYEIGRRAYAEATPAGTTAQPSATGAGTPPPVPMEMHLESGTKDPAADLVKAPPSPSADTPLLSKMPPGDRRRQWLEISRFCLKQAAAYNPKDYRMWWTLAHVELDAGNRQAAAEAADQAVQLSPSLRPEAEKLVRKALDSTPLPD